MSKSLFDELRSRIKWEMGVIGESLAAQKISEQQAADALCELQNQLAALVRSEATTAPIRPQYSNVTGYIAANAAISIDAGRINVDEVKRKIDAHAEELRKYKERPVTDEDLSFE